ncbi:MAG: protein NO VEIN domain-containing protein [Kaistella sp.]
MNKHLRILIDYSGSMGYMKGSSDENKWLLKDGSPRIDLVKKILTNDLLGDLDFFDTLNIFTFRSNPTNVQDLIYKRIYAGSEFADASSEVRKLPVPVAGGTPLFLAYQKTSNFLEKGGNNSDRILLIITDGDGNDFVNFDEKIIEHQKVTDKFWKIFVIGIDQNAEAARKSKNVCENTKGIYINLSAIAYDRNYFSKLLFEMKSSITNAILMDAVKSDSQEDLIVEDKLEKDSLNTKQDVIDDNEQVSKDQYISNLEKTVESNTVAITLIGKQLELISAEIIRSNSIKFQDDAIVIDEDPIRNAKIGRKAEEIANEYLSAKMPEIVLSWENEITESFMQYDFSFVKENLTNYIECKGTTGSEKYFYLSKNEWSFFIDNRDRYELILISELYTNRSIHHIENLFKAILSGEVVPYSQLNRNIKNGLVYLRIV